MQEIKKIYWDFLLISNLLVEEADSFIKELIVVSELKSKAHRVIDR